MFPSTLVSASLPMQLTSVKTLNGTNYEDWKNVPYASAVGSLMYAQVCTRPDIAFVVNALGRYLSNPGLNNWKAVTKVMRYLQGTKDYMLIYKRSDQLEVTGYSDFGLQGPTISLVSGF